MSKRSLLLFCPLVLCLTAAGQLPANPWFGTWQLRLAKPGERPETLVYSDAGHGAMRMVSVEDKSELVTRFDGKPAIDKGSGTSQHALAIKATSPTSYTWTFYRAGKPVAHGRNVLSADRKSFTEVSWGVATPEKKMTFIYDRQR